MELIRFTDIRGVEWEVWEVGARRKRGDAATTPVAAAAERWLCFATATERRRLARYPRRWHAMSPRELDALCRAARPARFGPGAAPPTASDDPTFDEAPRE